MILRIVHDVAVVALDNKVLDFALLFRYTVHSVDFLCLIWLHLCFLIFILLLVVEKKEIFDELALVGDLRHRAVLWVT